MAAAGCAQSTKDVVGDGGGAAVMDYAMDDVVSQDGMLLAAAEAGAADTGTVEDDDFMQMAAIEEEALDEMRGGFITAGGMKIDFGFVAETIVDGVTHVKSTLNLSDMQSGGGMNTQTLNQKDGTQITHVAGKGGIAAQIVNSASGTTIENINSITIDLIEVPTNLVNRVKSGSPLGASGGRLPVDVQRAYQGAIAR